MFKRFKDFLVSLTLFGPLAFASTVIPPASTGGGGGSDPNKWDLAGNSGTDPASNFLGSTDAQDIVLKANSSERFRLLSGSAAALLTGTLRFKGATNSNYAGLIAPTLAGSYSLTLPTALPGSTLPLLSTSGGVMSFGQADLTSMVTGVLPIANGGTNKALTLSNGGIPYFDADSFEVLAPDVSGYVLTTQGPGLPPAWAPAGGSGGVYTADGEGIEETLNEFSLELADSSLTKDATGLAVDWDQNPYKGQTFLNEFSGDNSTVAFVLSQDPVTENNTMVYVSGVYQEKDTYSVSGTTLTFSTAPPTGTGNIEVLTSLALASVVVAPNSVSTLELTDDAVYTANILDNAVTLAKMADNSVTTTEIVNGTIANVDMGADSVGTSNIIDSNVTTAKIADDNVTTAKILNANVTNAKLAADAVTTGKILDGTILEADLADGAVTSDKILDGTITADDLAIGAITAANLPAANYVVSSGSGAYTTTSGTYVNPTNLSVSLTTTGRPVVLQLVPSSTTDNASIGFVSGGTVGAFTRFTQDGTTLPSQVYVATGSTYFPCGAFSVFTVPSSGAHTFEFRIKRSSAGTVYVTDCKLVAREL